MLIRDEVWVIMMIVPNSLVRQMEGVQEEGKEESGCKRKEGQTRTVTSGADAPTGLSWSGVLDERKRRKHGRWYVVPLHRKDRRD